jgi:hypothetical protein
VLACRLELGVRGLGEQLRQQRLGQRSADVDDVVGGGGRVADAAIAYNKLQGGGGGCHSLAYIYGHVLYRLDLAPTIAVPAPCL